MSGTAGLVCAVPKLDFKIDAVVHKDVGRENRPAGWRRFRGKVHLEIEGAAGARVEVEQELAAAVDDRFRREHLGC